MEQINTNQDNMKPSAQIIPLFPTCEVYEEKLVANDSEMTQKEEENSLSMLFTFLSSFTIFICSTYSLMYGSGFTLLLAFVYIIDSGFSSKKEKSIIKASALVFLSLLIDISLSVLGYRYNSDIKEYSKIAILTLGLIPFVFNLDYIKSKITFTVFCIVIFFSFHYIYPFCNKNIFDNALAQYYLSLNKTQSLDEIKNNTKSLFDNVDNENLSNLVKEQKAKIVLEENN